MLQKRCDSELKKLSQTLSTATTQRTELLRSSASDREIEQQRQTVVTELHAEIDDVAASLQELRTGHVTTEKKSRQTLRQKLTAGEVLVTKLESECQQLEIVIK